MVRFRLLGPLTIDVAGRSVPCGPPKQRATLAALLVDAGSVVTVANLIDRVWGEAPPPEARSTLYGHISRIRALLATLSEPAALETRRGGYVLQVNAELVDALRARRLIAAARSGGNGRAALLREALDLWRGRELADVDGRWAEQVRESLSQLRLSATIQWAAVALELGQPDAVLDEIAGLADAHPFAEPLVAIRMRALIRAGRAAEALGCYAATCARLADELGTDPGPELREVHQALLRGELNQPAPAVAPVGAAARVPRQLPAGVAGFTGRGNELQALDGLLTGGGRPAPAVLVSAISGPAGVGKTSLTLHWAHRIADRFTDGQLYVDLRGYDPDQPVPAGEALAGFLRALGVTGAGLPPALAERAALFRTLLADRRVLVVLDNAADSAHVTPLLPGSPTCLALVTSRERLAGLVARHGAHRLMLDLLPLNDAVELLARLVGKRVRGARAAAEALAQQCDRLPLALRIVAEHLAAHPDRDLAAVTRELADEQRRLDLLDPAGEPAAGVRAAFSWSYRRLPPAAARVFRLLGLHPGPALDRYAAAALFSSDLAAAGRLLDLLVGHYLVHQLPAGRYGMHDLLAAYARECASEDPEAGRQAAVARLLDHYLAAATAARNTLAPFEARHRAPAERPSGPLPPVAEPAVAQSWLDQNRQVMVRLATRAAGQERWAGRVCALADALWRYLEEGAHHADAEQVHRCALAGAGVVGDAQGQARARRYLAVVYERTGRTADAVAQAEQALAVAGAQDDPAVVVATASTLGLLLLRLARYPAAAACFQQAIDLSSGLGDTFAAGTMLGNLAGVYLQWGRNQEALQQARQALDMLAEVGHHAGVGMMLGNLGEIYEHLGRHQEALDHHRQCLAVFRDHGVRVFQGRALGGQARVLRTLGRLDESLAVGQDALATARESGDREGETGALTTLGLAHRDAGRLGEAMQHLGQALDLAAAVSDPHQQASAINGLAEVLHAAGRLDEAATYYQAALDIAARIGSRPAQARARVGLAELATS